MRLIFMGTPEFALPSLQRLLDDRVDVVAVVTAPDKPRGRGQKTSATPVKEFAVHHGLPLLQPESLRDSAFAAAIRSLDPDLVAVVAFRILPREVFTIPRLGSFNLHASLLPKYRGAAPIPWAIINGERRTGVTTFLLQEAVDTGSILLQRSIEIGPDETAGDLHDRLAVVGADIVSKTVHLLTAGGVVPERQDEAHATAAPKIFRDDCRIDWRLREELIHNRVRGLSPVPTAWTMHDERVLKIYRTRRLPGERTQTQVPGTIARRTNTELLVLTGDGAIAIEEIQQEGKKRMSIVEFLRGYRIGEGDVLV